MSRFVSINVSGFGPTKPKAFDDAIMCLYRNHHISADEFHSICRWYYNDNETEHYGDFGIGFMTKFYPMQDEYCCDLNVLYFHREEK